MPGVKRKLNIELGNPVLKQVRRIEHQNGSESPNEVEEVISGSGLEENGLSPKDMVIHEISPIERRLREGRSFNDGNWKGTELKSLFELLKAYGTRSEAIAKYGDVYLSRSIEQILSKIDEIRQINSEHREDRVIHEKAEWTAKGCDDINIDNDPHFKFSKYEKVKCFVDGAHEIARRFFPHYKLKMFQETISDTLSQLFIPPPLKAVKVETSFGDSLSGCLSWENIHKFVLGINTLRNPKAHLTPLDASVILHMLDEIEAEAITTTTEEERAVFKGLLRNVKCGFFKDFEPDLPCSLFSVSQVPLDPFRTRLFDIPPGGCAIPPNIGVTIKRRRKPVGSTITLLSSNAPAAVTTEIANADEATTSQNGNLKGAQKKIHRVSAQAENGSDVIVEESIIPSNCSQVLELEDIVEEGSEQLPVYKINQD